jgi:hypothetical protein
MVLDGGVDPALTWDALLAGQSTGFDTALGAFLQDCERTRCAFRRAVDGDLLAAYDALAARVEGEPLPGDGRRTVGPGSSRSASVRPVQPRERLAGDRPGPGAGPGRRRQHAARAVGLLPRPRRRRLRERQRGQPGRELHRPALAARRRPYLALADRVEAQAPRFGRAIALSGLACSLWPVEAVREPAPVTGEGAPPVVVSAPPATRRRPTRGRRRWPRSCRPGCCSPTTATGTPSTAPEQPACVRDALDAYLLTATAPPETRC